METIRKGRSRVDGSEPPSVEKIRDFESPQGLANPGLPAEIEI
jgi:hypothetical protein